MPADDIRTTKDALYDNITFYNSLLSSLQIPYSAVQKANRLVSDQEFKTLLKAENLAVQEYWRENDPLSTSIPLRRTLYQTTAFDFGNRIPYASPTILPEWLHLFPETQQIFDLLTVPLIPGEDEVTEAESWPPSTFWVAQAGSTARLVSVEKEKYVANILPSTVHAVYAYRGIDGVRKLAPVPSRYYTKNESETIYPGDIEHDPFIATTITLNQPLSYYTYEDWEDGIYVTLTSDVSGNTADIIRHIAETYTDLTVDDTSFNAVKTKITNYPMNFALTSKQDAISLMEKIAWQGRCVTYARSGILYLKYLPKLETAAVTITEDDIIAGTLDVELTSTEDLITKFVARWRPTYAEEGEVQSIYRHNIAKYGKHEKDFSFFCYNLESLIEKSATFWMIRKCNTWKRVIFETSMKFLDLEVWDTITLDLQNDTIASMYYIYESSRM
jgi:hypothetical protein